MSGETPKLARVYEGWDGYNTSLVRAVAPLTPEQLAFRPGEGSRSAGEIAAHIVLGRLDWFSRMGAPGAAELASSAPSDTDISGDAAQIVRWLEASWMMIADNLASWTVDDLGWTYHQPYHGKIYAVSRQWVIWRIMAHDIHHGGQLCELLYQQGITPTELGYLGGHLTEPPLAENAG